MLTLGMAARDRGETGLQLPTPWYPSLERADIRFWRSQLCLVVGPGSAGKSLFISNLLIRWKVPTLAFLLDQDKATAAARFAAGELNEPFLDIKKDLDSVAGTLAGMGYIQADFKAESLEDIQRQLEAYLERYGEPPAVLVVDNIGNMTSGFDDEWSTLKALTLELDVMAREYEMLVICAHHTKDEPTTEPLPRSAILGKVSQYPRLILSVAWNAFTGEYKLAAVKNSSGKTDAMAQAPLVFGADPARMQVTELAEDHVDYAAEYLKDFKARTRR